MDLSRLSDKDIDALARGDVGGLSTEGLNLILGAAEEPVAQVPRVPKKSTMTGEVVRGAKQLGSDVLTGIQSLIGSPEEAAKAALARGERISEEAGEGPSFARLRRTYEEKGILPAIGQAVSDIPQAIAAQVPQLAAMAGAAKLGAMAGTAVAPGPGTIAGGIVGAGASLLPQFFGANIARQAEEQKARDEQIAIDRGAAATAAAGQAALEAAGTAFVFGKRIVKGVLGVTDDAAIATDAARRRLTQQAQRSLAAAAGRGAARGAATEMPVEIAQSVLERAQAGLDVTSEDALKEYGESAYLATLVGGPLGGVGGVSRRAGARQQLAAEPKAEEPPKAEAPPGEVAIMPPKPDVAITPPPAEPPAEPPVAEAPPPVAETPPAPPVVTPPVAETPPTEEPKPPQMELMPPPKEGAFDPNYETGLPEDAPKFLADIQDRNRATPAAIAQMNSVASAPDYDRLRVSPFFGQGAPVVMSDLRLSEAQFGRTDTATAENGRKIPVRYAVVEADSLLPSNTFDGRPVEKYADPEFYALRAVAGNGRIAGLQEAYNRGTNKLYTEALKKDTSHGVDPAVIEQMRKPVLVRLMPKSYVTADIGDVSNVQPGLGKNPVEMAKADVKRIDIGGLEFNDDGSFSDKTLRQFIQGMPESERGALLDTKGRPNPVAVDRLNNAVFQSAYGNDALIELYANATNPEAKLVLAALAKSASKMSKLKDAGEYDVRNTVVQAAEQAVNAARQGVPLAQFAEQRGLGVDENTYAVMKMIGANNRSAKRISDYLNQLADSAYAESQRKEDMFGGAPKRPVNDLFKGLGAEEPDLFTQPKPAAEDKTFQINKTPQQIDQDLAGASTRDALNYLVDNAPNSAAKYIAEKLRTRVQGMIDNGINVEFKINRGREVDRSYKGVAVTYPPPDVKVVVKLNEAAAPEGSVGTTYRTLMHEFLHAATVPQAWIFGKLTKKFYPQRYNVGKESEYARELTTLLNQVRNQLRKDIANRVDHPIVKRGYERAKGRELENIMELVAYGLTEPDFQDYLSRIKVGPKQTAFSKLAELFRKLLNIDAKYETALERIARVTETAVEVPMAELAPKLKRALLPGATAEKQTAAPLETTAKPAEVAPAQPTTTEEPKPIKRRPPTTRQLRALRDQYDAGKLSESEYITRIDALLKGDEDARFEQALQKMAVGRQRGADYIRERLLRAKRSGELSPEAVEMAEWLINKNPNLVKDLAISIRSPKEEGVGGAYATVRRLMILMKESGNDSTVVHEMLHHMERLMPEDIQSAIRKEWFSQYERARKKADKPSEERFFELLNLYHFDSEAGDGKKYAAFQTALKLIKDGEVSKDLYQYVNPSEFWAENGSRIVEGRYALDKGVLSRLKRWLLELGQKIKNVFGLASDAPVIRALNSLAKADGEYVTKDMLDKEHQHLFLSLNDMMSSGKEKLGQALQKRRAPVGGMQGIDPDLVEQAKKFFFPEKKTIVDKIESMKDRFWQRVAQGLVDQFRTIKQYSETGYIFARLSKAIDGALEGLILHGQVFNDGGALNIRKNTQGLVEIMKPLGEEVSRFQMWLALNREANMPAEKRSFLGSPEWDNLIANRQEWSDGELDGRPRIEVYNEVREKLNGLNRSVLNVAREMGLIDSSEYEINRINEGRAPSPLDRKILSAPIQERITELKKEIRKTPKDDRPPEMMEELKDLRAQLKEIREAKDWTISERKELVDYYVNNPGAYERFASDIYYIPFYREMEDGDVSAIRTAAGLSNQKFSKELKGGESPFADMTENVLRNWSHILSASLKNQAAVRTVQDAASPDFNGTAPNLKTQYYMVDGVVYNRSNDEIAGDGTVQPWMTSSEGKDLAKIMVNGQEMYYKVLDPLLLESIMSVGYLGPKSKFLDMARTMKNWLQFGVTISPVFRTNNLIRDSVSALAVSDLKKNPVNNVLTGMASARKGDENYIAALSGGGIFQFGSVIEGDQADLVKRLIERGVPRDTILDTPDRVKAAMRKAWDKYQEFGNQVEAANRLALYKQLRDGGMSHLEATYRARDLLDFSMQGAWGSWRILTQTVPFLNARAQGLYKLGRDGILPTARVFYNSVTGQPLDQTDKQKANSFFYVTSAVTMASLALYLAFQDDEEFQQRDAWDRDNFWWFKLPGMEYALRVPKPFEIGAIATLAERTLEQIIDQGAEGKQFKDTLSRMLFDTFAFNLPQAFKPLVDLYSNKDSFTGAPIESAGMERLSKAERATDNTSALAKLLGGVANLVLPEKAEVSPVQMDYAIKAYFGWLGGTVAWASNYAVAPFRDGEYPDQKWVDKVSLGYLRQLPSTQSRYVQSFYEYNRKFNQSLADMRHYAEVGQADKVMELLEKKGDEIGMAKFYDKTSDNMAKIRRQIRIVTNDPNMTGAEKTEAIDRMKLLISELAKQAEEARKMMKQ